MFRQKKKKSISDITHESAEKLKKKTAETAQETFTVLGQDVLKQLFDKEPKPKEGTFTPFDDDIRSKMGENFSQQESPELEKIRNEIGEHNPEETLKKQLHKKQLDTLRSDEKRARELLDAEEEERKQKELEEEEKRRAEEQQRIQANAQGDEPQGKQARGGLFAKKKKPKQTIENKPSQGKQ